MGLSDKLEKSAIIDLITVIVLSYDLYLLYVNVDSFNRDSIFSVTGEPQIIAVQITGLLILIYALEFAVDKFTGGSDDFSV